MNDTWQRQVAHKRSEQTEDAPRIRSPKHEILRFFRGLQPACAEKTTEQSVYFNIPLSINHTWKTENKIELLQMLFFTIDL